MCIVVQRHGRVAFRLRVVCTLLVGKSALLTVCVLSDPFLRVCSLFRLRVTFVSTVSCALATSVEGYAGYGVAGSAGELVARFENAAVSPGQRLH